MKLTPGTRPDEHADEPANRCSGAGLAGFLLAVVGVGYPFFVVHDVRCGRS